MLPAELSDTTPEFAMLLSMVRDWLSLIPTPLPEPMVSVPTVMPVFTLAVPPLLTVAEAAALFGNGLLPQFELTFQLPVPSVQLCAAAGVPRAAARATAETLPSSQFSRAARDIAPAGAAMGARERAVPVVNWLI